MSDILAALEQLDDLEREKKKKPTNTKYRNPLTSANNKSHQRTGRQSRPRSVPESKGQSSQSKKTEYLAVSPTAKTDGERSPSVASTRRISFVDLPRPAAIQRRLRIPTKGASLASGFPFDPKLNKYGVGEKEWKDFSDAIIDAAELPKRATWAWRFHKNDVVKKMKRELQYEGDFKRILNAWNRHFRKKGFQVSLELPGVAKIRETDTPEEQELARSEAKFFRLCVTPNAEKAGSIYSRTSSLTRSVTGEGNSIKTPIHSDDDDEDGEKEGKEENQGGE
ncbi:hypothetical protein BDZ45DRAFT_667824 [Acephala macrosclerotiorum]|nr:hypothetical protein BDZ45DRAFT_667824 [Acephala macrosclerotiorum]